MTDAPLTAVQLHRIAEAERNAAPLLVHVGRALSGIDRLDTVPFETKVEAELREACTRILLKLDTIATLRKTANA